MLNKIITESIIKDAQKFGHDQTVVDRRLKAHNDSVDHAYFPTVSMLLLKGENLDDYRGRWFDCYDLDNNRQTLVFHGMHNRQAQFVNPSVVALGMGPGWTLPVNGDMLILRDDLAPAWNPDGTPVVR